MSTFPTSSAFKTHRSTQPNLDNLNIQIRNANLALRYAVSFANSNEMAMLVDRAISKGANINHYDRYENHLMVIAVRSNQPHAIAILMARGLEPPFVQENGVNILMEAAAGFEKLIDPLVTVAGIDIFATDHNGKTALHHAVKGGSKKNVNILLEYGAQPDVYTTSMDEAELCSLFGNNHILTGKNITPLMIASATGHHEIAALLLAAKASPIVGECLPLELACKKGHAPTIKLLLEHQTQPKFTTEQEHAILRLSLESGASLECLRLIVGHHCFDEDNGTPNSPLGAALKTKQVPVVALLLACGAPIEKFYSEKNTLWDEAFENEKKPWELLDLLVTKNPLINFSISEENEKNLLTIFFDNCKSIIPLSAAGFYPSLIHSAQEVLQQIAFGMLSAHKMQQQLQTAFILSRHLAKISNNDNLINLDSKDNEPDSLWIRKTHAYKLKQKVQLQEYADLFITNQYKKLRHALSLNFFLDCANTYSENHSLKNFIKNKLSTQIGLPEVFSLSIAHAWSQAAQWTVDWDVAPDSVADANRFLMNLMNHNLKKTFQDHEFDSENLHSQCIKVMLDELSLVTQPLNSFCNDPVAWLRKFEHRSNLRPVDIISLAKVMQIELGLPVVTCQAISNAWSMTINRARKSTQWKTPAELDRLLAIALAPMIKQCLSDEMAQRIIPDKYLQNLSLWVERVKNQPIHGDTNTIGRKRPSSEEPDDAPPRKEPRL